MSEAQRAIQEIEKSEQKREELIKRLEDLASKDLDAYKAEVRKKVSIGYTFLGFLLFMYIALTGSMILLIFLSPSYWTFKLALIFAAPAWYLTKALWVKIPPPEGLRVNAAMAPELFAMIGRIQKVMPLQVHEVILNYDLNAAVTEIPRYGIWGGYRRYLMIGLPLMFCFSEKELEATLAHEFGHFMGKDAQLGHKVYRIAQSWIAANDAFMKRDGRQSWLLGKFTNWYLPLLQNYYLALSRRNEYDADRIALKYLPDCPGTDLIRLGVYFELMERRFWPSITKRLETDPKPPQDLFGEIQEFFKSEVSVDEVVEILKKQMAEETKPEMTHPSLSDRLKAMDVMPKLETEEDWQALAAMALEPPQPNSAEKLFGASLNSFKSALQKTWEAGVHEGWADRHVDASQLAVMLRELEATEAEKGLTPDQMCQKAELIIELEGRDKAIELLDKILEIDPEHPRASFLRGMVFAEEQQDEAYDRLEIAAKSPEYRLQSYDVLRQVAVMRKDPHRAERYNRIFEAENKVDSQLFAEAQKPDRTDQWSPVSMDPVSLRAMKTILDQTKIERAYLCERPSRSVQDRVVRVCYLLQDFNMLKFHHDNQDLQSIVQHIAQYVNFNYTTYIVPLSNKYKWILPILESQATEVYRKET